MTFRLSTLAALACMLAAFTAHAAEPQKDCPDKPATVQKKRPAHRAPARVVQPARVHVVAPVPTVTVLMPPAPQAVAPAGTCVNVTSGRSDSLSMAWTDWQCVTMQKARLLQSLGKADAAVALLCSDPQMREALSGSGTACPGDGDTAPGELPVRATTASAR